MARDQGRALPPPADLASRPLNLRSIDGTWHRIGKTQFLPRHYTQSDAWRFSAKDMPGTLYLGDGPDTCFWEVFWDDLVSRPLAERLLDEAKILERSRWQWTLPRAYRVVDTTDPDVLNLLGAHGGTFLGPYDVCQHWAAALRRHPCAPDGLLYESVRRKRRLCLALFAERTAHEAWPDPDANLRLIDCPELANLTAAQGWRLLRTKY